MENSFDINNLVRENVKTMKPYSSARDEFKDFDIAEMIFLDANENPFENGVNQVSRSATKQCKSRFSETKKSKNKSNFIRKW